MFKKDRTRCYALGFSEECRFLEPCFVDRFSSTQIPPLDLVVQITDILRLKYHTAQPIERPFRFERTQYIFKNCTTLYALNLSPMYVRAKHSAKVNIEVSAASSGVPVGAMLLNCCRFTNGCESLCPLPVHHLRLQVAYNQTGADENLLASELHTAHDHKDAGSSND